MAYEDSGFGIRSITVRDESIRTITAPPAVLSLVPSLHPVFSSDGKDNVFSEESYFPDVLTKYGSDFDDVQSYGLQNLIVQNVLEAGGKTYICRLLPENATTAHHCLYVGIKEESDIPVYKRDIYGSFLKDENNQLIQKTIMVQEDQTTEDPDTGETITTVVEVEKSVTTSGYKIKTMLKSLEIENLNNNGFNTISKLSNFFKTIIEGDDGYKYFPLFFMNYYANGKCGNNYGLRIVNDLDRDERVEDGRRYILYLVKKTNTGAQTLAIGDTLAFSFNPYAVVSPTVPTIEGLHKVYQNYDGTVEKQIKIDVFQDNYAALKEYITELLQKDQTVTEGYNEEIIGPKTMEEFDFLYGINLDGYKFDNIVVDEESVDLKYPQYMNGGSDGDFETLTGEALTNKKNELLKKFFNCLIDTKTITNVLKCDAGIVYDSNYPLDVKKEMVNLLLNRRDIGIIWDTGFEDNIYNAVAVAKTLASYVPTEVSENFVIVPHCGTTVDRNVNCRVTGTYEFAYGLTRLYRRSPFAIYAGKSKDNGCVRKTIFDWVVEETIPKGLEEKLAKQHKLYWATDLGKAVSNIAEGNLTGRNIYFYSDANLYHSKISKLAEFRNSMIVNDIRRVLKLVLCKYTFETDGAQAAINKASEELYKIAGSRYPSNVNITFDLFQTDRDKLLNCATCHVIVTFPDIFETWDCTIFVRRNEVTEEAA